MSTSCCVAFLITFTKGTYGGLGKLLRNLKMGARHNMNQSEWFVDYGDTICVTYGFHRSNGLGWDLVLQFS